MNSLIEEMYKLLERIRDSKAFQKLCNYYDNKFYAYIFLKQYEQLCSNIKSINALLTIDSVEDAYTIFRKYLETYFIMMSIYENKDIVGKYMVHDAYVGYKACGEKMDEIKLFIRDKPEGFLEYGYLDRKAHV